MSRMNIETLIVPTDFSDNAKAVYPVAADMARAFGAKIHLVHVFEAGLYFSASAVDAYAVLAASPAGWLDTKIVENEQLLITTGQNLAKDFPGIDVTTKMLKGNPVKELTHYAGDQKSPMIVISTHGYTGFTHAVLGSIAERIVRTSPCPVLTIRPSTGK